MQQYSKVCFTGATDCMLFEARISKKQKIDVYILSIRKLCSNQSFSNVPNVFSYYKWDFSEHCLPKLS